MAGNAISLALPIAQTAPTAANGAAGGTPAAEAGDFQAMLQALTTLAAGGNATETASAPDEAALLALLKRLFPGLDGTALQQLLATGTDADTAVQLPVQPEPKDGAAPDAQTASAYVILPAAMAAAAVPDAPGAADASVEAIPAMGGTVQSAALNTYASPLPSGQVPTDAVAAQTLPAAQEASTAATALSGEASAEAASLARTSDTAARQSGAPANSPSHAQVSGTEARQSGAPAATVMTVISGTSDSSGAPSGGSTGGDTGWTMPDGQLQQAALLRRTVTEGAGFTDKTAELARLTLPGGTQSAEEAPDPALASAVPLRQAQADPFIQLGEQLVAHAAQLAEQAAQNAPKQDMQTFTIHLTPDLSGGTTPLTADADPLGEITVRLAFEAGKLSVTLTAQNETTRALLAARSDILSEGIRAQNVDLSSLQVVGQSDGAQTYSGGFLWNGDGPSAWNQPQSGGHPAHHSSSYAAAAAGEDDTVTAAAPRNGLLYLYA